MQALEELSVLSPLRLCGIAKDEVRARAREANLSERAMAVTFPGEVGDVLGLDIDMVLQQDPFDWSAYS